MQGKMCLRNTWMCESEAQRRDTCETELEGPLIRQTI